MSDLVKRYTASIDFDKRLWRQDINGSLAHAKMLAKQGIIQAADLADIEKGMAQIVSEIEGGQFEWSLDLEDVHLNIEKRLTTLVGDAGKRLHTGRSRNDQVATDIRLWLRDTIDSIVALIKAFQTALLTLAEKEAATPMPGSTHLQVAQPVTFGHHLLAYFEMTQRDKERFLDCRKRANRLPLGAAALAGTTYPIDREFVAQQLGFDGVCENSLDAVSDRDFGIEFCAACSLLMTHFSRLSEELVLWMNPRFGYVKIADRFCTGSSIMPMGCISPNPGRIRLSRGKSRETLAPPWCSLSPPRPKEGPEPGSAGTEVPAPAHSFPLGQGAAYQAGGGIEKHVKTGRIGPDVAVAPFPDQLMMSQPPTNSPLT